MCGASCAYFLFIGKPQIAGTVFWVEVLAFMLLLMVQNKINEVVVLLIGISPLINYLRVFAFYNIVVLLFGTSFFFLLFRDSKLGKKHVVENPGLTFLFVYQLIYYILTYINTGDYWANLRGFELLFVAGLNINFGQFQPKFTQNSSVGSVNIRIRHRDRFLPA